MPPSPQFTHPSAVDPGHVELPAWSADEHDGPHNHAHDRHHRVAAGGRVLDHEAHDAGQPRQGER